MIQLRRDRAVIHNNFTGQMRRERLLELFQAKRDGTFGQKKIKKKLLDSGRWKNSKPQLKTETFGKCAFCEAPTSATYYGDVEHFRPKSIYWWLAYCYDNYLYSCRVCNGKKGNEHRLTRTAIPAPGLTSNTSDGQLQTLANSSSPDPLDQAAVDGFKTQCDSESAHLPHPYYVDPEKLFRWTADDTLREVKIDSRPGSSQAQLAFDAADQVLGLNREELRIWRWLTFRTSSSFHRIYRIGDQNTKDFCLDALRDMVDPRMPFSAMIRFFAVEEWGLPL